MAEVTLEERFWRRVDMRTPEECWLWTGCKDAAGYGVMMYRNKMYKVHHLAWMLEHGCGLEGGAHVQHTCNNRTCCNPQHLIAKQPKTVLPLPNHVREPVTTRRSLALSDEDVRALREEYAKGGVTQMQLAAKYHVSVVHMNLLLRGKIRRTADGPILTADTRKKLTDEQVHQLKKMAMQGTAQAVLAEHFRVSQSTVSMILRGKVRKAVSS